MRWLADESVEVSTIEALRIAGYDVEAIREIEPGAPDDRVLDRAHRRGRILITDDLDFGELVIRDRQPVPGIVLLRLSAGSPQWRAQRLLQVMAAIEERMPGSFVVIENTSIRWRSAGDRS